MAMLEGWCYNSDNKNQLIHKSTTYNSDNTKVIHNSTTYNSDSTTQGTVQE